MNRIKCSVASCQYNEEGKMCQADEIKVRNNIGSTDNMEFGSLEDNAGARTTVETCCETFAPKKSNV